ncbi:MAG: transcription termination/antitermination factor NusG [Candidatus Aureabacteria bacterium]|nr:transcription termination/antitermination factor NusG [Candidatus Auribacterota bacterium]
MTHQWYVIQVMSGWEQKVKDTLEKRIQKEGFSDLISQVLIPAENVSEIKSGKKKISRRKFFPGYILVQMDVTDRSWYFITETNGIIGFAGEKPVPLLDHEVESILNQIEGKKEKVKPKVSFEKGDNIKVTDGPFVNFNGTVDEINPDRGKLKVMVLIFGRPTPVELEYWQVEKV